MSELTVRATAPQSSDWPLLALFLAWTVSQGSLMGSGAASPAESLGNATFILGAGCSVGLHELVTAALARRSPAGESSCRSALSGATAGPLANLLFGALMFAAARTAYLTGGPDSVVRALAAVVTLNFVLVATLFVPALPMDGGQMLRAIIWAASGRRELAMRTTAIVSQIVGWVLLVVGLATAIAYGVSGGFIWLLIAAFIFRAGRRERRGLAALCASDPQSEPSTPGLENLQPRIT